MRSSVSLSPVFCIVALSAAAFLAGCSTSFNPSPVAEPGQTPLGNIKGSVYGGRQPVVGSRVYLLAAGTGGYGTASTSLLQSAANTSPDTTTIPGQTLYYATSDSNGQFSLNVTGDYTCTQGTAVYIYAVGGDAGAGTPNAAAGFLAGLGMCPNTGTMSALVPSLTVNEVSTIVTAYALAGFATDAMDIGIPPSSAGATTGLTNAMANIPNIMNVGAGTALTTAAGNGTANAVPQSKIYALANVLAACVNSNDGSACTTLFSGIKSNGATGTAPTDTATAAIYMAKNQSNAPSNVFSLSTPTSPFQTAASSATDFAIGITYAFQASGGGAGVAVDAAGDVFVVVQGANVVSKYSPQGTLTTLSGGGLSSPYGAAVDSSGVLWVADTSAARLSQFNTSTGAAITTSAGLIIPSSGPNMLSSPDAFVFDATGHVWIMDSGKQGFVEADSTGNYVTTVSDSNAGTLQGVAVDPSGNFWVSDLNSTTYFAHEFPLGTTPAADYAPTPSGKAAAEWLQSDSAGNIWVTSNMNSQLIEILASDSSIHTWTGGGMAAPLGMMIDGSGNVFVANNAAFSRISAFNNSGIAITTNSGYATTFTNPHSLTIDQAGNVWVSGNSKIVQFLGMATPTAQPLTATNQGQKP